MQAHTNGQGPSRHPRRGLLPLSGWASIGFGVLVAAFCVVMAASVLPVGDTAREVIFVVARVANLTVLVTWVVRWSLRWRRTGRDAVSAMSLGAGSQRLVRGCIAVLVVLLVVLAAARGEGVAGWALLPRLMFALTFAGAGLTAMVVVIRGERDERRPNASEGDGAE